MAVTEAIEACIGSRGLRGEFALVPQAQGVVVFADGRGGSQASELDRQLAGCFRRAGFATLLFDLLTEDEAADPNRAVDIATLAGRLIESLDWLDWLQLRTAIGSTPSARVGIFGAGPWAAAALTAAATAPERVAAVVARNALIDVAATHWAQVRAPTLLIIDADNVDVLPLNREGMRLLTCTATLEVVNGKGGAPPEAGAEDEVAQLASEWFERHVVSGDLF